MNGVDIDFLVDSGSTSTLLSKETFDRIVSERPVNLIKKPVTMQGVNGTYITTHGQANIGILFGDVYVEQTVIVCDISQEGILGQDFIMDKIKVWDLRAMEMLTYQDESVHCYQGGQRSSICMVLVREDVEIPPPQLTDVRSN